MMTIEFHTAHKKVSEKLITALRNELLELSHVNKQIARAEVFLKEDETILQGENNICEIRLTIFGDNLLAHARAENFEKAAKETTKELKRLVKQQVKKQHEPPDSMTSTVKV
jgi:putative sigma-54 modulation protein